ncbi:MAG: RecX family transcriptional regulator [Ruminococcus sp.]|nr:RecX family transcriptional regulator [Ruminococcus sp.]
MKITSIRQYKGSTYEVTLDEVRKIYLHADIIADFSLCSQTELSRDELRKIIYASNFRRAFQYALHLLDYRDYSHKEMLEKLVKTYKNEALCEKVMKKLTDIGVINDKRFAERMARKLIESKRYGLRRAMQELYLKGIDKFTAQDALVPYEDSAKENLACLLEKKYSRLLIDKSDRKSIEKVKNSLVRYGYGFSDINEAVKEYFENTEDLQEDL